MRNIFLILMSLLVFSCTENESPEENPVISTPDTEKIYITVKNSIDAGEVVTIIEHKDVNGTPTVVNVSTIAYGKTSPLFTVNGKVGDIIFPFRLSSKTYSKHNEFETVECDIAGYNGTNSQTNPVNLELLRNESGKLLAKLVTQ